MSGATVPVPVAVVERMLGELLAVKMAVSEPMGPTTRGVLVETLSGHTNLLGEALSIAEDHAGPDFEALLDELIKELALHSGRHFVPTLDRAGVDAALAVLADMAPALGALAETKDWLPLLREAVKVQTPVYRLEIVKGSRLNTIVETIEAQPCARIPLVNEEIILDDGRCATVAVVTHKGAAVVVRAKVWGHPGTEEF